MQSSISSPQIQFEGLRRYLHVLLCRGSRAESESHRRAWLPDVARSALSQGCCAICALRLAAISRPLLFHVPISALQVALLAVLDEVSPVDTGTELYASDTSPCIACLGLLQGNTLLSFPAPGSAELGNFSAAQCVVRWGTTTPPPTAIPAAAPPQRVSNWLDVLCAAVAHSGFDLSGGLALSMSSAL